MFQASTWHGRHAFAVPLRGRLGVECEIAVRLARYVDYPSLDTPTLIADDFFHYACVLGPPSDQTQWVQAGDVVAVTNDSLGAAAADFTARPS